MWRYGRASDEEGLRLMLAFFAIEDPAKRRQLIAGQIESGEMHIRRENRNSNRT